MSLYPQNNALDISPSLLWEYDLRTFGFDRSKRIIVERIVERGGLKDWREMVRYFGKRDVLEVVRSSKQLSEKDKNFTEIFIHSKLLDVA